MISLSLNIKLGMMIKRYVNIYLELAKIRITFFVAVSASLGYILAAGSILPQMIFPTIGVFLLASGSSAVNHFQESNYDRLMNRTRNRPIPRGDISPLGAVIYAIILIMLGFLLLFVSADIISVLLGLTALIWYNFIYTPLKRINSLAVIPGSLIGAIPPVIGWAAAGRNIMEPEILSLAMFFFIWQIPHFWLLLIMHGEEYVKAGYPSLTQVFNKGQLSRITYVWIISLAVSSLLIPLFSLSATFLTGFVLFIASAYLVYSLKNILYDFADRLVIRRAFMLINIYVLCVVAILIIDKLILSEI
ncbi:MAG: protoheme IX farnesyltransferase [Melioribacteraceae bacterium]|nr:protoheme IX farnesyltransferase [Melioribacteraceae bacterium]